MKNIEKVGIIGLGALGSMYAKMFQEGIGRENVYVLADRSRIEKYKKEGTYYNGQLYDYNYTAAEDLTEPLDLIVFACKFGGLLDCIDTVKHLAGPETTLISVLNGITSEEVLSAHFDKKQIVWCYAKWMAAKKLGNQVTIETEGRLVFGMPEGMPLEHYNRLSEFVSGFRFPHDLAGKDIIDEMWGKFLCNVGLNQATMAYDCSYAGVQTAGESRDIMMGAMREVQAVGNAKGIAITDEIYDKWLTVIDNFVPTGESSMRQDRIMKRPSEVDLFAGTIIRFAKELGIDVPYNQFLYDKIKAIESEY